MVRDRVARLAPASTWFTGGALLLGAVFVLALQFAPAFAAGAHDHDSHGHGAQGHAKGHGVESCRPIAGVKGLCTHGPDTPPSGVRLGAPVSRRELRRRAATGTYESTEAGYTASALTVPKIACLGDGRSGPRVQAIYARAKDRPDRYSTAAPLIAKFAASADAYVNRSAAQVRSGRRIRFVTDDCKLKVLKVTLSPRGDDSFGDTVKQLANKGYNKSNRKYLIWMDAKNSGICGIGSTMTDDRATLTNDNNTLTGFARIDRSCWGGGVEAHELFHTFGAVQNSAPHSNGAGHCFDEIDAMCYADGSGVKMKVLCPSAFEWQLDCGHNDYFNPRPKAGTYLDRKWNTARSRFLEPTVAPPTEPVVKLPSQANRIPGLKWSVSASSSASGKRTIARWKWQALQPYSDATVPQCRFSNSTVASPTFWCAASAGGTFRMAVTVWDNTGLSNVKILNVKLAEPSTRRATTLAVSVDPSSLQLPVGGGTVRLAARVVDAATGKPVIGLPLSMYASNVVTGGSKMLANSATSTTGRLIRSHVATATTRYDVGSYGTMVWKPVSTSRTVKVALPALTTKTAFFVDPTVAPYASATLKGVMAPRDATEPYVRLQRFDAAAGRWEDTGYSTTVGDRGGYTFWNFDTSVEGAVKYRVVKAAGVYAAATSPAATLTVARVAPTITLNTTQTRNGDGSVTLTGSITPRDAVWQLHADRDTGVGWETYAGTVTPGQNSSWQATGQFTVTVSQAVAEPLHSYLLLVDEGDQYLSAALPFDVTFTKQAATIVIDEPLEPDGSGQIVVTGSVSPAPAAGVLVLQRWDGLAWHDEYVLTADYGETGYTGVFSATLYGSEPTRFRVHVPPDNWTYSGTSDEFTVAFP